MKTYTNSIENMRKMFEADQTDLQTEYQAYFKKILKDKFKAESPADLDDAQKIKFFNEIKKGWEKGVGPK